MQQGEPELALRERLLVRDVVHQQGPVGAVEEALGQRAIPFAPGGVPKVALRVHWASVDGERNGLLQVVDGNRLLVFSSSSRLTTYRMTAVFSIDTFSGVTIFRAYFYFFDIGTE